MLLLSKADIKKVFTMKDAVEADKEAFRLVVRESATHRSARIFKLRNMKAVFFLCRLMWRKWTQRL